MMTASQMSAAIRAKKKKMKEEHSDAVKLSGIPEDATDHEILKQDSATDHLDENHPKDFDEEPSLEEQHAATVAPQPHDEKAPDPKQINQPGEGEMDEENEMKKARIRASFIKAMSA